MSYTQRPAHRGGQALADGGTVTVSCSADSELCTTRLRQQCGRQDKCTTDGGINHHQLLTVLEAEAGSTGRQIWWPVRVPGLQVMSPRVPRGVGSEPSLGLLKVPWAAPHSPMSPQPPLLTHHSGWEVMCESRAQTCSTHPRGVYRPPEVCCPPTGHHGHGFPDVCPSPEPQSWKRI